MGPAQDPDRAHLSSGFRLSTHRILWPFSSMDFHGFKCMARLCTHEDTRLVLTFVDGQPPRTYACPRIPAEGEKCPLRVSETVVVLQPCSGE